MACMGRARPWPRGFTNFAPLDGATGELSATLFGLFTDGLHQYLESVVPTAGVALRNTCLRELVYACSTCVLTTCRGDLQALTDALAVYFGMLFCTWRLAS